MPRRDEFDDPEGFFSRLITDTGRRAGSLAQNRALWVSGLLFVVVVALSGVIWASYPSQSPLLDGGAVPIIRADAENYKYVPADRGGMMIAHQDSTVFDAMRGGAAARGVENLLSDADERPVDRAQLFAGLKTDLSDEKGTQLARMDDYTQERPMTETERRREAAERNRAQLKEQAAPLPGDVESSSKAVPGVLNGVEVKAAADEAGDASDEQVEVPSQEDLKPAGDKAPAAAVPTQEKPKKEIVKKAKAIATKKEQASAAKEMAKTSAESAAPQAADVGTAPAETPVAKKAPASAATSAAVADLPASTKTAPEADQMAASAPAAGGGGSSYVQVSSVPSESAAAGEWKKLSAKLPMLAGQAYRVKSATVSGRAVHRIQVGPMSLDAAKSLCAAIKAKKPGGCLVVK